MFSNREIATILWITAFSIWGISKADIRASLVRTLKSALHPKLIFFYFTLFLYLMLFSFLLYRLDYWSQQELKDTIVWYLFVAIPLGGNATVAANRKGLWKNAILDNLKFLAITEFLIGKFSYNMAIELIQIPVVSFLVFIQVLPGFTTKVKRFADNTLVVIGVGVFTFTIVSITRNNSEFFTIGTLNEFFRPLVYSLAIIPYLFFISVYSDYDALFIRIRLSKLNRLGKMKVKFGLMWFCGLNSKRIKVASSMANYNLMNMVEPSQFREARDTYKSILQKTSNNSC